LICVTSGKQGPAPQRLTKNTLIIPTIPNYPGFDFFYYQCSSTSEEVLYLVSVTVAKFAMRHVDRNDNIYSLKNAVNYWKLEFLPENAVMRELWMIGKDSLESDPKVTCKEPKPLVKRKDTLNVIYFEEMVSMPALKLLSNKK
jgi:hypothetical protein